MLEQLRREMNEIANPKKAAIYQRFFKTGKGEYGEGDVFIGLTTPESKNFASKFVNLNFDALQKLLGSEIHEERGIALGILTRKYKKDKKKVFDFYLKNTKGINNWDLVDCSCYKIVGDFLLDKDRKVLYNLARSASMWERRIAIVSTFAFIRKNEFDDALKIAEILLKDANDLIHNAVGWMLREIGKRDEKVLEDFLKKHYEKIPRTTLRYAIERFEEEKRKRFLKGEFDI